MPQRSTLPIALTVAGSDSGGGAGVQADLKTFAALGVHGISVITCLTAQNPRRVTAIEPVSPRMVRAQLEALFDELPPRAAKTGMLYSAGIIGAVAAFFEDRSKAGDAPALVVDPVMVATSGAVLLQPDAIRALREQLLPLATLVTPNADEAALLTGRTLRSLDDLREAACALHGQFGVAALVKGGHLPLRDAVDVLFDGRRWLTLRARRIRGVSTHGTGCTYSAAIAAGLARGLTLVDAVRGAKRFVSRAIAASYRAAGHDVLHPLHRLRAP
ncbi:MAG: bifunctional hydroxymethylpyrimidine kinase/phosphomethylpyrimidine kinase [Verrucomicrobiae bacterium]|nr:bifunctional hydroxymethylpyrimidine kinase/phosphomethylpyrimidine kinase [Verrucomicrobiae bacterium]